MANTDYALQDQRSQDIVAESLREFAQLRQARYTFESHWQEIAELIDPTSRNTFTYLNYVTPGEKKTDKQIDSTGMLALDRFAAICNSLLTPRNMKWHELRASNEDLWKDRSVRLWFEQLNNALFKYRYAPIANFSGQNHAVFRALGAYGTAPMFIDELDAGVKGIRYKALPLGEVYIRENHQGLVDGFIRWFRWNARQAYSKWGPSCPPQIVAAYENKSEQLFTFVHRVVPRNDYDPQRFDGRGKKWGSYYINLECAHLMSEKGYHTLPLTASRYVQMPGDGPYGRSAAMAVLPGLKTLNAEKRVFLKAGHRASDPVLLTYDDGSIDPSLRPGALNKGGVNADGQPLIHTLPVGNIQINEKMMDMEKGLINDSFLVTLFQILTETPQMTATEVIERTNEKGILLAPTVGRQQDEYLGPMVEREVDVLMQQNLLPPMPPILEEAQGEYEVLYTTPMSRAMRAQEAAGFMRTVEMSREIVNITQDPSYLDWADFDQAMPEIADINGVKPSWTASPRQIADKRKKRADAQARQEAIQAAPAQAAMMKAAKQPDQSGQQPQQPGGAPPAV